MTMLFTTNCERRALMADRERAARPLDELVARERVDLATRPAMTLRRPRFTWGWAGLSRAIHSLPTPALHRPAPVNTECVCDRQPSRAHR